MNKKVVITAIAAATLTLVSSASAQIIGVDFYLGSQTNQTPGSSAVVGPDPSAGWYNEVDPSTMPGIGSVPLLNSSDAATTATFGFNQGGNTLSGNPIYNSNHGPEGSANATLTADQQLYNGSVTAVASSWSQELVLQNIPYASYAVYLLVNAPRVASDTPNMYGSVQLFNGGVVGGASTTYFFENSNQVNASIPPSLGYVQATGTSMANATLGANYVLFTGLTNPNVTFDFVDPTASGQPYTNNITLGAIEIVNLAAAPEPSTYAMLLAGLGLLTICARRRLV
jgi:hypothetical protein